MCQSKKKDTISPFSFPLRLAMSLLSGLYGFLVLAAGSGTSFFAVWFAISAFFAAMAADVKMKLWEKVPALIRKCICMLAGMGIICFLFVESYIVTGFLEKGEQGLDAIIVLGAQVYDRGPSVVLKYRLDTAFRYLQENPDTICIVTGGQGYNEPFPEAVGMADYLMKQGIDPSRIILEKQSKTTIENFRFSLPLLPDGACVGIVTNNFHIKRALWIARKQGLQNVCGISADSTPLYLPNNMLREFLAMIKTVLISQRGH